MTLNPASLVSRVKGGWVVGSLTTERATVVHPVGASVTRLQVRYCSSCEPVW